MPWLSTYKWNGHGHDPDNRIVAAPEPIKRWVNDFPLNRVSIGCLPLVLQNYAEARHVGYSTHDAAAYAMACKESCWHSGWNVALKPCASDNKWYHRSRVYKGYTRERFLRVVANSLGRGTLGVRALDSIRQYVVQGADKDDNMRGTAEWIGLHFNADCRRVKEARRLRRKYENIVGTPNGPVTGSVLYDCLYGIKELRTWKAIEKGRQLFIKGWGPFNIAEVAEDVAGRVISVETFVTRGYDIPQYLLERLKRDEWFMQYTTRWITWLRHGNNRRIDELYRAKDVEQRDMERVVDGAIEHFGDTGLIRNLAEHPETVCARYARYCELGQRYYAQHNGLKPQEPLDQEWPWVTEKLQSVDSNAGTLIPISTLEDLQETSKVLENCAGGYGRDIQRKSAVLVKLVKDGNTIALAEYGEDGMLRQCSMYRNEKCTKVVRELFESYKPRWQV